MLARQARYIMSFLFIMLTIGINLGQHILEMLNIDRNYLLLTLLAVTIAGLLANRHLLFIVLVAGLTVAINMPAELLAQNQVSMDALFSTLIAVIFVPAGIKLLGWDLTSTRR